MDLSCIADEMDFTPPEPKGNGVTFHLKQPTEMDLLNCGALYRVESDGDRGALALDQKAAIRMFTAAVTRIDGLTVNKEPVRNADAYIDAMKRAHGSAALTMLIHVARKVNEWMQVPEDVAKNSESSPGSDIPSEAGADAS